MLPLLTTRRTRKRYRRANPTSALVPLVVGGPVGLGAGVLAQQVGLTGSANLVASYGAAFVSGLLMAGLLGGVAGLISLFAVEYARSPAFRTQVGRLAGIGGVGGVGGGGGLGRQGSALGEESGYGGYQGF